MGITLEYVVRYVLPALFFGTVVGFAYYEWKAARR